jgi:hypothetical protein
VVVETWVVLFGNNSISVEAGQVSVRPGLGRHQLVIPLDIRATRPEAADHNVAVSGQVSATRLEGGGGYLGTAPRTLGMRLYANSKLTQYLLVDLDPGQIDAIERRRSGSFTLNVACEVFATNLDGTASETGSGMISDHPVTREDWLTILDQTRYRQTMVVELAVPDAQTVPHLSNALGYLADARRRSLEGEHRLTVESLRQALASIRNMSPDEEDDTEAVMVALKAARNQTQATAVGYRERYELARQALKFLTDLGAHPEVAETTPAEARSALIMVTGILQWFTSQPR